MTTERCRAWLLDLDGTLYRHLPVKLAIGLELVLAGRSVVPIIRRFRTEHDALRGEDPTGDSPFAEQIARTAEACELTEDQVRGVVQEWMFERPGKYLRLFRREALLAEVRAHRGRGGCTALVSDYPAAVKLEALGVRDLFDVVVASGEPGGPRRLKPDPHGYLAAARALDTPPEECLVIGDRQDTDGDAARRAGMRFRLV